MRININSNIKENTNLSLEIELKTDLIDDKNEENEKENENEKLNIDNDENKEDDHIYKTPSKNIDLPHISFFDFLFNKFYFKCFGQKNQIMINSCNNIVAKYLTVEKLIYNQIKLEYLWKDYK